MLEGTTIRYTKEEQLELGRIVQLGLKAQEKLDNDTTLTNEEVELYSKQVLDGENAHNELFISNINFANKMATEFSQRVGNHYSLEDIAQDAYLALSLAINTYDPSFNTLLMTHAYYRTTKELSTNINKMRGVRLPENKMTDYLHITRAEAEYKLEHDNIINVSEMLEYTVEKTGISRENIALIKNSMRGAVSINKPINEEGTELGQIIEDNNAVKPTVENAMLNELISKLSEREQEILALDRGVGATNLSLKQILKKYNIKEEDLSKESNKIVRKLKGIATKGGYTK